MKTVLIFLFTFSVIVSSGYGTYDVDDAWRQMSGMTDHSATFSAITSEYWIQKLNQSNLRSDILN